MGRRRVENTRRRGPLLEGKKEHVNQHLKKSLSGESLNRWKKSLEGWQRFSKAEEIGWIGENYRSQDTD